MRLIDASCFLVAGAYLPLACGQRPPDCKVPFGPDNCNVVDYCRIDLDQASMEAELEKLTEDSFRKAREIYERGGHSNPLAELKLATPLSQVALKGTKVAGFSVDGMDVTGRVRFDLEAGSTDLLLEYTEPSLCQVGGLGEGDVSVFGCLAANGVVSLEFGDYQYAYDPLEDNKNGRTLASISHICEYGSCAELYTDYYGLESFANEWMNAAFEQRQTNFMNGNVDFGRIGFAGRANAISKGTVVLSTFVEINRLLTKSVESCRDRNMDDALHYLKAAKCMYTGSLVGHSEDYSGGELMFTLADKMCVSFKTCGANGDELSGTSQVNSQITMSFQFGEDLLSISDNGCRLNEIVETIISWLYVPIIQGALRSSYLTESANESNETDERAYAEGAAYAAALLPRIHAMGGPSLAQRLHDMMIFDPFRDTIRVKSILEIGLYPTLPGLSCMHVGGLYDPESAAYVEGHEPCDVVEEEEKEEEEEAEDEEWEEEWTNGQLIYEPQELPPSLEYFSFEGNDVCPCKGDTCGPGTSSVDWYSDSVTLEDCATYCLQYQFMGGALKGFTFESYPYGDNFENHYCACLFDFGHQQDNMFATGFSGRLLEQVEEGIIDDVLMHEDDMEDEDDMMLDDAMNDYNVVLKPSSGVVQTQDGWVPSRNIGNARGYQAHCYYFTQGGHYDEVEFLDDFIDDRIEDDDDEHEDWKYELSNKSVQYDSCVVEDGKQFVRFHLCSGTECQSCSSSSTEHEVDMSTYLHLLVDYHEERQYRYCRSCDICLESRLQQNERPQFCIQTDPDSCYEECQNIKNMEDNGYIDGAKLIDCQLIYEDDEESLYAGPVCSSGGSRIKIGLFEDDLCEIQDSRDVEDYLKNEDGHAIRISYHLLKKTFLDCSSCLNEDALYDTRRRLEQFMPLTKEMCTDLMAASGGSQSSDDWLASSEDAGQSSLQYHSCGVDDNLRQFVKYHSCPGAKCQSCDSSTADEYVVDLSQYLEVLVEYHQEEQQRYCDLCNECYSHGGTPDDVFNPWTFQLDEFCSSQVEPKCYGDCQFMLNLEENGYIEDYELVECQVVYEGGTFSLYAGPQCDPDGNRIVIGLFEDELCQIPDEREVEEFLTAEDGSKLKIYYNLFAKSLGCSGCNQEYARRRLDQEQTEEQMCTDLKRFSEIVPTQSHESVAPSLAPFFLFTGSGGSASGIALNEDDAIYATGPTGFEGSEMDPDMSGQSSGGAQPTKEATNETLPNRSRTSEPTVSPTSESDFVLSPEVEFQEAEEDYPNSTPVIVQTAACIAPLVAYWLNL